MAPDLDDGEDMTIDLTLSERVARASARQDPMPLEDGTILVVLSLHRLEPSALPRPNTRPGIITRMRRRLTGRAGDASKIRYVQTRRGDDD
jgi:hypothetical protein